LLLDVRVISSLGFHPCGIATAITFQNTCEGYGYEKVSAGVVDRQLRSVLEDELIAAVKIGLLNSKEIAEVVVQNLKDYGLDRGVVLWDPVYTSTTKLEFFQKEFSEIAGILSEAVSFLTPNAKEAELLSGMEVKDLESAGNAAKNISGKFGCAVVVTGGRLKGVDVVYDGELFSVQAEYSPVEIRGTGCIYSSALTCYLARGEKLEDATRHARLYLLEAVKRSKLVGKCHPCSEVGLYE
jgi:hydroxymethylpyrimidine/phosphomethylpyrimidine kinase